MCVVNNHMLLTSLLVIPPQVFIKFTKLSKPQNIQENYAINI